MSMSQYLSKEDMYKDQLKQLEDKYNELNEAYGQEMILSANLKAELEELKRKLTEEFEGKVDINSNGRPNTAMRVMNIVRRGL